MPKIIVLLVLFLIVVSLGSALISMMRGRDPARTARALTIRIGLSVALFILILIFMQLGWVTPHGVTPG